MRISILFLAICCFFLLHAGAGDAEAQVRRDMPIQTIPAAETSFNRGIAAYDRGDYDEAHTRFMEVVTQYAFNRKTTAAHLMAGKALLAQGNSNHAIDLLTRFLDEYPDSRYFTEAQRTRDEAFARLDRDEALREAMFDLGVVLPLGGQPGAFSQSLFNGIRLAVDEHNARNPLVPVRMSFQNTAGGESAIRRAVRSLVGQHGAEAIIGPLMSEEAMIAGEEAERQRIAMVAPLATEDAVAGGRRYVYMANPSWSMRGRLMARFAVQQLRMRTVGVVAQRGTFGERMAEAFRDEARRLGADVNIYHLVASSREWSQLHAQLTRDTLRTIRGLYLPVTGRDAPSDIQATLYSLNQIGADVRLLGNGEWHALPISAQASHYQTVYELDYWVDERSQAVRDFTRRYRDLAGEAPDRTAFAGYDVARFMLQRIENRRPGESVEDALRTQGVYQGLGVRIDFSEGMVNTGAFFVEYRAAGPRLMY